MITSIGRTGVLVMPVLALLAVFSIILTGCNVPTLISGVAFNVEPNIETAKVQLNFGDTIRSDLGGSYPVANYGSIELQPWSPTSPFNVGFRMNLSIVNDQDFARLNPVTTLPSGQPLPFAVNRAMAQIKLKNQLNKNFDVYAYVDVVGKEWVGVAVTLNFVNNQYFPAGLSVSQNFLNGKDGFARAVAAVFGPQVDSTGKMTVPGGIALFANIASLIKGTPLSMTSPAPFSGFDSAAGKAYFYDGPLAPHYRAHPEDMAAVAQAFAALLNSNTRKGH